MNILLRWIAALLVCVMPPSWAATNDCFRTGVVPATDILAVDIDSGERAVDPLVVAPELRLEGVPLLLKGRCIASVTGYSMAGVYLGDLMISLVSGPTAVPLPGPARKAVSPYHPYLESKNPHPQWSAGTFVMAAHVGGRAGAEGTYYVGLWRGQGRYTVAGFWSREGGFSVPRKLLDSTLPLRSVAYFPAPDSNSGSLFLVQDMGGVLRLSRYFWRESPPSADR
jgi:hypothetical protein